MQAFQKLNAYKSDFLGGTWTREFGPKLPALTLGNLLIAVYIIKEPLTKRLVIFLAIVT